MFAVALAVSVVGLVLLYYASKHVQPPYSRIQDISVSSLERNVRFAGYVHSTHRFDGGSHMLTVVENNSMIEVFLPQRIGIERMPERGSRVEVTGTVQLYNGRLEVVVGDREWIKVC
ncbi:MAG: hypothetical protein ABIH11_00550 [Candidatus Altiarchaeota archaeon]